jgi:hypothetical protein
MERYSVPSAGWTIREHIMKGWGFTFLLVGVLSFVLPYFNMAMLLTAVFAPYDVHAAVGFVVLGIVLIVAGFVRDQKRESPRPPPPPAA